MPTEEAEHVTCPGPGCELCYECEGKRFCIFCGGRGVLATASRCSTCYGDGKCIVCNGAGELTIGSKKAATEASR